MFSKRTQVLLSPQQRARLELMARRRDVSIGALIREAIDAYTAPRTRQPREALEALFALEAPVGSWEAMKGEVIRGAVS